MRALAGLLALAGTLALSACGTGGLVGKGDPTAGAQLFTSNCGSCHTLRAAGTKGTIGPNLDYAFAADRAQGYDEGSIRQLVGAQIRFPSPPMPPPDVTFAKSKDREADIASVAAFVASVAGNPTAKPISVVPAGSGKGGKLYVSLGCQACHSLNGQPGTGPSFKGLAGSRVKLTGGKTTKATLAYLIESIVDPDKQIVASYKAGVMTSVIKPHQVSPADAKALAKFIESQK